MMRALGHDAEAEIDIAKGQGIQAGYRTLTDHAVGRREARI